MIKEAAPVDTRGYLLKPINITVIDGAGDGVKQGGFGSGIPNLEGKNEFSPENIPHLDFIPVERGRLLGNKNAARHELQHAIVAKAQGISVGEINCVGDGRGVGGWTVLGPGEDHKVQIVLAAGGVGGTGGTAGDEAMSQVIDWQNNRIPGVTFPFAGIEAEKIIYNQIDSDTLSIASDILAYLGEVNAPELNAVLERAQFEALFQSQNINLTDLIRDNPLKEKLQQERYDRLKKKAPVPESGNGIVIEEFGEFDRITVYDKGIVIKEEIKCPICGKSGGGHFSVCEFSKRGNKLGTDNGGLILTGKEWDNGHSIRNLDLNGKKREGGVLVLENKGDVFSDN